MSLVALMAFACAPAGDDDVDGSGSAQEVNEAPKAGFLDAKSVADLVTISPSFPFAVTRRHAASGPVLNARWGRHGGPTVTTQNFAQPDSALKVHRWTLPTGATGSSGEATQAELSAAIAPSLPAQRFWGADGYVDLPFGALSMNAYSSSGDHFPGEVVFYSKDYDRVVGRAHVNGFYSGVGITNGTTSRVLYSGLSGFTAAASTAADDSGLYATNICSDSPLPTGSCPASQKLIGWAGSSGPVTADADGNVFVAAFVSGAPHTDPIYGLSKAQTFGTGPQAQATVSEQSTGGTASLAAVSKPGSGKGFLIAKGHDGKEAAPAYARAYHSDGAALVVDGAVIDNAIAGSSKDVSLSFFADPQGNLWVAVELNGTSTLLELQPRP